MHAPLPPSAARLLLEAGSVGNADLERVLAPLGLTGPAFLLLTLIGSDDDATERGIADRVHVARSRISQMASRLTVEALVSDTGHAPAADGRRLRITSAGLEVHAMAVDAVWRAKDEFAEPLDPVTQEAFRELVDAHGDRPS